MHDLIVKALDILATLDRHAEEYGEYRMVQLSEEDVRILREALEQALETKYEE